MNFFLFVQVDCVTEELEESKESCEHARERLALLERELEICQQEREDEMKTLQDVIKEKEEEMGAMGDVLKRCVDLKPNFLIKKSF